MTVPQPLVWLIKWVQARIGLEINLLNMELLSAEPHLGYSDFYSRKTVRHCRQKSREEYKEAEWDFNSKISLTEKLHFKPDIDYLASRVNTQLPYYV